MEKLFWPPKPDKKKSPSRKKKRKEREETIRDVAALRWAAA